jgi:uncharacterized chromosomal cassette SCCmec type IVc protein CR006
VAKNKPVVCVEYLENYTSKSFVNFTNKSTPFWGVNYIYGNNGAGKSSLARGISEKGNSLGKGVALFNADYTRENLLFESNPNLISGVEATFGSENIDTKNKIAKIESEIEEIKGKIEINNKDIVSNSEVIKNKIKSIFDENKKDSKIRNKSIKLEAYENGSEWINKLKEIYSRDLNNSVSTDTLEDVDNILSCGIDEANKRITLLERLTSNLPGLSGDSFDFDKVISILEKEYKIGASMPRDILDWIADGLRIHNEGDECKFCSSNEINIAEIEEKYNSYRNQEWSRDQSALNRLEKEFKDNIKSYESAYTRLLELAQKSGIELNVSINLDTDDMCGVLGELLGRKLNSPEASINCQKLAEISKKYSDGYRDMRSALDAMRTTMADEKKKYHKYVNNIEEYEKKSVAQGVLNELNEGSLKLNVEKIENCVENNKEYEILISEKIEERDAIKRKVSRYRKFMEYLNSELKNIGMPFRLHEEDINSGKYLIKNNQGENISIHDVSEGEKHVLSLMYFYYTLFDDEHLEVIKDDIEVIVIDDPVSSLDEGNKLYILNMVIGLANMVGREYKEGCKEKLGLKKQIFILSHSWEDYTVLSYHRNQDISEQFEVYKQMNDLGQLCTTIRIMGEKETTGSYARLFKEIYEISKLKDLSGITECQENHSLNSMRRVFEEYLSFKSRSVLLPQYNNIDRIVDIYELSIAEGDAKKGLISNNYRSKLSTFLSDINVGSHRIASVDGKSKIIQYAKTLMKYIQDTDKVHYNAMKQ